MNQDIEYQEQGLKTMGARMLEVDGRSRYVLLTAAHNEGRLIAQTIETVVSQSLKPAAWVIVSDRSTDRTDAIIQAYSKKYSFIRYLRLDVNEGRGVISKVNAIAQGYGMIQGVDHDFVGNLDADVTFDEFYFENLLEKFLKNPTLGIGGGLIHERRNGEFQGRLSNSLTSVAHAAQIVRRTCYNEIGGYVALKYGGEDWFAEIKARMHGWRVQSFSDLRVLHHRPTGAADPVLRHRFREGRMDFSVGSHPLFEVFKCARRIPEEPVAVGALTRLVGFCCSYLRGDPRLVSAECIRALRREQLGRLGNATRNTKRSIGQAVTWGS